MAEEAAPAPSKTWAEFLASSPPDSRQTISDLFELVSLGMSQGADLNTPDVFIYCSNEECQGFRKFERTGGSARLSDKGWKFLFLHYRCRNCQTTNKIYAVAVCWADGETGEALKFGETPPFGPHTPARVISLIGPNKELFLQGRRCENHGLGIGAFSYYRRVVDNQRSRIIGEIAKVAKKLGAELEVLKRFAAAAAETQFSKAIEEIKDGIPAVLLIDGHHNPLTVLHSALSEGLHEHTDEECLQLATEIRIVLTDLADRLSQALKEEAALKQAVSRLLRRKSGPAPKALRDTDSAGTEVP